MSLIVKLVISLVIAIIAYTLSSLMATGTVSLGSGWRPRYLHGWCE